MAAIVGYQRPSTISEALDYLVSSAIPARVLAGGTDLLLKYNQGKDPDLVLVDITEIDSLTEITASVEGVRIGSAVKIADLVSSKHLSGGAQVLAAAAATLASPQIRNLATIGGNICNAAPSADTAGALLVLNARVEISSLKTTRLVPIQEFFQGPGETILEREELVTAVLLPTEVSCGIGVYLKHAPRNALECAIAGLSVWAGPSKEPMKIRLALTAVAPTPRRAWDAENFIQSEQVLTDEVIEQAAELAVSAASPIDDVRASSAYRLEMVRTLMIQALRKVNTALSSSERSEV